MNAHSEKHWESKSPRVGIANSLSKINSKVSFQFAQHRPEAITQRKMQQAIQGSGQLMQLRALQGNIFQRSPAFQNNVIQLTKDEDLEKLYNAVKKDNSKAFASKFRSIAPAMDEEISCKLTFDKARRMYLKKKSKTRIKEFLAESDKIRLPTGITAHHVKLKDGTRSRVVHPTAKDKLLYGAEYNAKKNPRWTNHTSIDRERREYVGKGNDITDMKDRAIEFSLSKWVQPPFAKNSVKKYKIRSKRAREAHKQREALKKLHSGFDPSTEQDYNAKWIPKKRPRRDVSPERILPPNKRRKLNP